MKLFVVLTVLTSFYMYMLMHTTNIVLAQTQHLNASYQYVANNADRLAIGQ
jgi:hypothetical protein